MGEVAEKVQFMCAAILLTPPPLVSIVTHETQVWIKSKVYTGCASMKPALQDNEKTRGPRRSLWLTCSFTQPTGKLPWA